MPSVFQDLQHGLRALASRRGVTVAAALSLGLAIGAQTSVYCLIDALFLRAPVGVTDAERLIAISALRGVPVEDSIRYPDYLYYRDHNTNFAGLASVAISEALSLSMLTENIYAEVPMAMRVVGYAGGLGLLLTAIGLYGVLALAVGQRTREIGVRMALGARVPSILSLILREGIALALSGLALGLASAIVLSRLLARFLYGITVHDPATYAVATVLVGGVVLAACAAPAWRAARVDPMVALRHE